MPGLGPLRKPDRYSSPSDFIWDGMLPINSFFKRAFGRSTTYFTRRTRIDRLAFITELCEWFDYRSCFGAGVFPLFCKRSARIKTNAEASGLKIFRNHKNRQTFRLSLKIVKREGSIIRQRFYYRSA